jgi:hypothetical protein
MPVGDDPLLRIEEDMDGDRLLAPVGLRHRGDADERADLDVGERRLHQGHHPAGIDQLDLQRFAAARLDVQGVAVDLLDLTANSGGLRLLCKAGGCGEHQRKAGDAECAPRHLVHGILPKARSGSAPGASDPSI